MPVLYLRRDPSDPRRIQETLYTSAPPPAGFEKFEAPNALQVARKGGSLYYLEGASVKRRLPVVLRTTTLDTLPWPGPIVIEVADVPSGKSSLNLLVNNADTVTLYRSPDGSFEQLSLEWDQAAIVSVAVHPDEIDIYSNTLIVRFEEPTP